jgi:hypothetical protein
MTTVSNPKSKPPRAPVRVAFIRFRLGRMFSLSSVTRTSYRD